MTYELLFIIVFACKNIGSNTTIEKYSRELEADCRKKLVACLEKDVVVLSKTSTLSKCLEEKL